MQMRKHLILHFSLKMGIVPPYPISFFSTIRAWGGKSQLAARTTLASFCGSYRAHGPFFTSQTAAIHLAESKTSREIPTFTSARINTLAGYCRTPRVSARVNSDNHLQTMVPSILTSRIHPMLPRQIGPESEPGRCKSHQKAALTSVCPPHDPGQQMLVQFLDYNIIADPQQNYMNILEIKAIKQFSFVQTADIL